MSLVASVFGAWLIQGLFLLEHCHPCYPHCSEPDWISVLWLCSSLPPCCSYFDWGMDGSMCALLEHRHPGCAFSGVPSVVRQCFCSGSLAWDFSQWWPSVEQCIVINCEPPAKMLQLCLEHEWFNACLFLQKCYSACFHCVEFPVTSFWLCWCRMHWNSGLSLSLSLPPWWCNRVWSMYG